MKFFRKLNGCALGVFFGTGVIFLVQNLGHKIYPLPEGISADQPELIQKYIETAPLGALGMVLAAWGLGAFFAGLISAVISRSENSVPSVVSGTILMIFGVMNLMMIPHPIWFMVVSVSLFLPSAYVGYRLKLLLNRN